MLLKNDSFTDLGWQDWPKFLHLAVALLLSIIGGVSICMTVWIIPLILFASPRARIRQFDLTIDNGRRYLQSGSRILTFIIAAASFTMYARPGWTFWDSQFLVYITTVLLLMSVGIGEIFYIFPINDRVLELGEILDHNGKTGKDDAIEKELAPLLKSWQLRNFWTRAVPVMVASVSIALAGPP